METCNSLKTNVCSDFPRPNGIKGAAYLKRVSSKLLELRRKKFSLNSPTGATLTIGPLEDTEYRENPGELDGCSKFYLSTTGKMEVIGYVEGTHYPCEQLILMICGDGKMYGYDGDELHEVASSLSHLFEVGIDYPASSSYYYGEAFKHMTTEDWDTVRSSPQVKKLEEKRRELIASPSRKSKVLELIEKSKQKRRLRRQHAAPSQALTNTC
ncbi:uncharacterized protein LOC119425687 [Nematolebias whitei]|uniref:uncharacterized protein LOC119425687 n=1 Tax=Nematolebias whitei TaxID=451745 RepID=UPI00189B8154|nr:uncharacterized protein LOC119425687 [Nematolebias whitei]